MASSKWPSKQLHSNCNPNFIKLVLYVWWCQNCILANIVWFRDTIWIKLILIWINENQYFYIVSKICSFEKFDRCPKMKFNFILVYVFIYFFVQIYVNMLLYETDIIRHICTTKLTQSMFKNLFIKYQSIYSNFIQRQ